MCRASEASTAAWPRSGSPTSIWSGWTSSWPPFTRGSSGAVVSCSTSATCRIVAAASRVDEAGNRYERRRLAAGGEFEIVKNFFDGDGLARRLAAHGRTFVFEELERFWMLSYRAR